MIDVLTMGGPRTAHHFVGVHWRPQTRLVAFGPVSSKADDGGRHGARGTGPEPGLGPTSSSTSHPSVSSSESSRTRRRGSRLLPRRWSAGHTGGVAVVSAKETATEPRAPKGPQSRSPLRGAATFRCVRARRGGESRRSTSVRATLSHDRSPPRQRPAGGDEDVGGSMPRHQWLGHRGANCVAPARLHPTRCHVAVVFGIIALRQLEAW